MPALMGFMVRRQDDPQRNKQIVPNAVTYSWGAERRQEAVGEDLFTIGWINVTYFCLRTYFGWTSFARVAPD